MAARLCLWAALLTIWALQTMIFVVTLGATAQFSLKLLNLWLGGA
jgi:hypothetical protein